MGAATRHADGCSVMHGIIMRDRDASAPVPMPLRMSEPGISMKISGVVETERLVCEAANAEALPVLTHESGLLLCDAALELF